MAREFGYKILLIDFKPRELELHLEAQRVTKERPDAHQVDKDVLERMHKEHRGFLVLAWIRPRFYE
ncbi:hypothetical protein ACQJ5C_01515 [Helicobacter pylori]